ncbi:MAG: PASTA domain-containing protein [bacterium]
MGFLVNLVKYFYIYSEIIFKPMKKKSFRKLKKPAIILIILIGLFFLFDSLLMPIYIQKDNVVRVPNTLGKNYVDAVRLLKDSGLTAKKADVRNDKQYPEGTVVSQNPIAGAVVKIGRGVYLTISGGEVQATVPGLKGKSIRDATFALEKTGFILGGITYEISEEFPIGTIISQDILEGVKASSGSRIQLIVSQGKSGERVVVPILLKMSLEEAQQLLAGLELKVGNITYRPTVDLLPNTVIEQFPRANELVLAGQSIDLFLAQKVQKNESEH